MKISILIPVYNSENRLSVCLDSVLGQTYADLEIIIINDGSTDNSEAIIKKYEKRDKRIRYYSQRNIGISGTRNKLVELMTGDYALFVDSDDKLTKNACEELARIALKDKCDLVVFDHYREYDNGVLDQKELIDDAPITRRYSNGEAIRNYISNDHKFSMHLWRRFYSKRLIKSVKFNEKILPEDYYTAFDYYRKANGIIYTSLRLYIYYISCSGLTCRGGLEYELQELNVGRIIYKKEQKYFAGDKKSIKRITTIYCNRVLTIYARIIMSKDNSPSRNNAIKRCNKELLSLRIKDLELKTKIARVLFRILPKISSKILLRNSLRKREER